METRQDELRRDLDAAVQARKELGKEYESELVDSFLARLDSRLDARVEQRVSERPAPPGYGLGRERGGRRGRGARLQVFSLVMGVPLSGIAAGTSGLMGLVVCWAGIVGVNFSAVMADRREERGSGSERGRSAWD
ncbi:hypothetical protein [Kitasatospora sp. NPDC050543]|uniref:hypothetical protein n=1 Tax=Kitasatospora sp. NPDC050543 TaxID=3364054 RepID=UPI0037BCA450